MVTKLGPTGKLIFAKLKRAAVAELADVTIDDEVRTAIKLVIEPRK